MSNKTQTRYIFAIFFILCGLIIGIVEGYECIVKHYYGGIPLSSPVATELKAAYPDNVWEFPQSITGIYYLGYNITSIKLLDNLPYTTSAKLLWLVIPTGLAYTTLGILAITKRGLLFRKD